MTDLTASFQQSPSNSSVSVSQKQKSLFIVAAIMSTAWMLSLLILSVTTANPVTLNRDQIIESTDVLTALVDDPQSGVIQIQHSWKDVVGEKQIKVADLGSLSVTKGERYIIPVLQNKETWQATPSKLPKNPRLIYPASDEAERQLKSILKTGHLP